MCSTISSPACKNNTIHHTTFVLPLNDAKNIPFSGNIIVVRVSSTVFPLPPSKDINSWLTGIGHWTPTIRAVSCMLFNIESLYHTLSTHFERLYTNLYHIGRSDGAVSCNSLNLKIYGSTPVCTYRIYETKITKSNHVGRGANMHQEQYRFLFFEIFSLLKN